MTQLELQIAAIVLFFAGLIMMLWPRKQRTEHACGEACGPREVEDEPPAPSVPSDIELMCQRREIERRMDRIRHGWKGDESVQQYCAAATELRDFDEMYPKIAAMFQ